MEAYWVVRLKKESYGTHFVAKTIKSYTDANELVMIYLKSGLEIGEKIPLHRGDLLLMPYSHSLQR